MESPSPDWLVYVYAITEAPVPLGSGGIDLAPIRWISEGSLSAAVSDVPMDEFDEAPLNELIRDMAWLGPRAVAHQEVNLRLHESAQALIPLAFGTVFRHDERVRALLRNEASALAGRLETVRGSAEWVVALHLLAEPDAAAVERQSPALHALRGEIEAAPPGRAHLLRRRLAELERDEGRRVQAEAAGQVLERLRGVTRAVFAEPLPQDTVERPLLRASVLVARDKEDAFLDETERLRVTWREPTYRVLLTGPWPPYRFGGLNADG
ncbi:MAG TPA: GvpL/GvpF family gas vesicle protein [Chloroflexota bacterium]|jgi:hypothetical protein|nr:GvpL/GvpF family gas vesicle protein [Chloroflexota bacterium]